MPRDEIKLSEKQRDAISRIDSSMAVIAGAGSGKTLVLTERIKRIIESGSASFSEITAITFTEKAAGELLHRIMKDPNLLIEAEKMTITTIDGFCKKIVREEAPVVGIAPNFQILDEYASKILNHRVAINTLKEKLRLKDEAAMFVVDELDFKHALHAIEDLLEERWYVHGWNGEPKGDEGEARLHEAFIQIFGEVLRRVEEEKQRLGVLDFVDLEIQTLNLLEHEEVRNKYQTKIKHLLIDEYQDTSALQTEIIKRLFNPKKMKLFIVGDAAQSIYRFRGADPSGLEEMKRLIAKEGGAVIELDENYRSGKEILEFINKVFVDSGSGDYFIRLKSCSEIQDAKVLAIDIGPAGTSAEETRKREAELIAEYIRELHKDGVAFGDIAVLFKSFTDIQIYERALEMAKIPYYKSGGESLLEEVEVRDIILFIKALVEPTNDTISYGLARSSIIGLDDSECYKMIKSGSGSLFSKLKADERFQFIGEMEKKMQFLSASELVREIAEKTSLIHGMQLIDGQGQSIANLEKFIQIVEDIDTQYGISPKELIDYLDDVKERGRGFSEPPIFAPRDDAVKLFTIHSAKGLEFDTVIIADLFRKQRDNPRPYIISKKSGMGFKLYTSKNALSERRKGAKFMLIEEDEKREEEMELSRLLYVAMTRAKRRLVLPLASDYKNNSRWLDLLTPHISTLERICISGQARAEIGIPILSPAKLDTFSPNSIMHVTVSHIESYARCPREYFLKYCLHIPSEHIGLAPRQTSSNIPANIVGSVVHNIINIMAKEQVKDEEMERLIGAVLLRYGYYLPSPSGINKIKRLIASYKASEFYHPRLDEPIHEMPFIIKYDGFVLKGTIDCAYKEGRSWAILDFKTDEIDDKSALTQKISEYSLQIIIYAMAMRDLSFDIKKASLLFLENGHIYQKEIEDRDIEEGRETVKSIISAIKDGRFEVGNIKRPCFRCPYYHNAICSKGTA